MNRNEIRDVLLEIIADIDEEADFAGLDDHKPLRDQLDLDSMDFLDIVMELRKRYKLQIPEDEYPELATLSSCVNYLEPKLRHI
ncbi:MAG: acyl carrier protein [Desulfobulbus sp.]|jgi:acyl carrier protein